MMTRLFIFTFAIFVCGQAMTQSKSLPSFTSISTSGSVQVELVKSSVSKADYTILKGDEDDLYIEVKGNELYVKIKSRNGFWNSTNTKAKVTVHYQNLRSIDCAAGSSIKSESEIVTDNMDIESSSGASCSVVIKSTDLNVDASSGSKVAVSGSAKSVNYDASSGARIDAASLLASDAIADVSSGASISLYASNKLNADASSGGSIKYKGDPEKTNISSGISGSIRSY
ncbi:MAG: DUF2807 domain-containing protein [Saprospiraceae bacterium]|jgi:hypothetical protein|nr:DUF2807 domain-containing protein [Saprospiraceae bacterium]